MALSTQVRSTFPWKYDVFLSFGGEDTRFTDCLYDQLRSQEIIIFRDDPQLERGTAISLELLTAIKQSRFAIVVLSPNYASSPWYLLRLSKIFECMKGRGQIMPVFYEVEPSHLRRWKGSKEVEEWSDVLSKAANLAGWKSNDYRCETELVKDIVQAVCSEMQAVCSEMQALFLSEDFVGVDTKLKELDVLLDKEANDVRFIGIWGMGGLGKTTLAKLVFQKVSYQFEVCIFLANVRELSAKYGLVQLQEKILSHIGKKVEVSNVDEGRTMIKRYFCNKVVLLVLDDVDESRQLDVLVGEKDWFGLRSRIIITTRDKHVLVNHGVLNSYELKGLNEDEALVLFSQKAFRRHEPEEDYAEYRVLSSTLEVFPWLLKFWGLICMKELHNHGVMN